jgi:hypothetical protein
MPTFMTCEIQEGNQPCQNGVGAYERQRFRVTRVCCAIPMASHGCSAQSLCRDGAAALCSVAQQHDPSSPIAALFKPSGVLGNADQVATIQQCCDTITRALQTAAVAAQDAAAAAVVPSEMAAGTRIASGIGLHRPPIPLMTFPRGSGPRYHSLVSQARPSCLQLHHQPPPLALPALARLPRRGPHPAPVLQTHPGQRTATMTGALSFLL